MRVSFLILTVCLTSVPRLHAQTDVPDDVVALMRMASQNFRQGTNLVDPLSSNQTLTEILKKDGKTSDLASLLSARILLDAAHKEESNSAWATDKQYVRKRIMEEAFETLTGGLIEHGLAKAGVRISIPPIIKVLELALKQAAIEQDVVQFRKSKASQDKMATIAEIAFAAETYNNLVGDAAEELLDTIRRTSQGGTSRPIVSTNATARMLPTRQPHAVFLLTNNSSKTIPWAFIKVRLDCECRPGTSGFAHKRHSRAHDAKSNVDKTLFCFVQDWQPQEEISLAGTTAPEYYHTTKAVSVTVLSGGGRVVQKVDMDKHRQYIINNCWPRGVPVRPPMGF